MLQNFTKSYKKCYKSKFVTFYIFCILQIFLTGCSKKEPSTAIVDSVKSDIVVIEQQIEYFKQGLPKECQNSSVSANLNTIQANIKTISTKVENIDLACKTEKEVLRQENSKLKIIIGFMFILCGGFIVLILKNHKIL